MTTKETLINYLKNNELTDLLDIDCYLAKECLNNDSATIYKAFYDDCFMGDEIK